MKSQRILLIHPEDAADAADVRALQELIGSLELPLTLCDAHDFGLRLDAPDASDDEPAVLIFPQLIRRPSSLARRARAHWPRCEILFLQPATETEAFRRSLGLAPMLGSYWSIVDTNPATLGPVLVEAAAAVSRRARFRTTLDRANASLQLRLSGTDPGRANIADHYLANFIDFAQDAIIGIDLTYQVLFWSSGAEELFAMDARSAVGRSVRQMPFWSDELEAVPEELARRGRSMVVERSCQLGERDMALEIHCSSVRDADGMPLGVSLMIRDVSAALAQRAASEALMHAEHQHLYQLFHQAPGFVAVTQGPRHMVELANRAFHQLVGRRDVIGLQASEAFPQMEGETLSELLDRVYTTRRPFVGRGLPVFIHRSPSAAPELRYVDFVFQPVLSEHGLPSGIFCQGNDVTAQKLMQEQLKRSEEHLEALVEERTRELERSQLALHQAQKLEAIGKLTGGVAHDFNNVLQIIGANLQLMRDGVAGQPHLSRRLEAAASAVERGAKLSSQLLAFARRQPLQPSPLNLARQLRGMDDLLRRALGEDIQIETVVAGGLWTTLVDPHQLENVVLNLAINARDAMRDGGQLTLELSNAMLDDEYARSTADVTPGQYVLLAVSDTGCGMSATTVEHAFEPFYTTKPEGQGTGLGLSMAYGFAKQSGGHIRIYSEPGNGTTVKLYLPRSLQEEIEPVTPLTGPVVGGSETILVVEDDPAVQAAVIEQLTGLGYNVLRASDAQSALSILQSGLHIDVLFTDVVMPGPLRSPELARQAKQLLPDLIVLFTSGYTQNAIVHGGKLDPGVELISKPYRLVDLARKLRHLLANRAQSQAMPSILCEPQPGMVGQVHDILLVEDQQDLLEMTRELLIMLGHDVMAVASAEDALEALAERRFSALLTDVGLPGMSGEQLADKVRARWPETRIALITGYGEGSGGDLLTLAKPFNLEQLRDLLAQL
ncbi:response regulator [Halopseudomonas nanhaiensis]|uniref:response regulator n=1 Tax=Halopseudomonas nanhaiensis TaxID=2830842 RepID=UPI001CBCA926|nr:response regulator [Halopseudomonas nanhaiensis]